MAGKTMVNGTVYNLAGGGGQTLVNGTGHKVNSGKTLIDGAGRNITFETPKKWYWNETVSFPSSDIGSGISFTTPDYYATSWIGLIIYRANQISYEKQKSSLAAYIGGRWGSDSLRTIVLDAAPEGEFLNYLRANATPIYD